MGTYCSVGDYPRLVTNGVTANGNWWGAYTYYPYPEEDKEDTRHVIVSGPSTVITNPIFEPVVQRCKYCGIKHHPDEKYCEACGAPL